MENVKRLQTFYSSSKGVTDNILKAQQTELKNKLRSLQILNNVLERPKSFKPLPLPQLMTATYNQKLLVES